MEILHIKADSFPVGANVHFPTDLNLLWDSARKCIEIAEWFSENEGLIGWRKSASWKRKIKSIFRSSSKASSSGGKNKENRLHQAVSTYLDTCGKLEIKIFDLLKSTAKVNALTGLCRHKQLTYFHEMLVKHIDLVKRRILEQEVISSSEKLFSIFEPDAEWLTKGKKFKPVEIGHNVLIASDQFDFIVYHKVMEGQTDSQMTEELASTLVARYPKRITSLSLDKGFYSKENLEFVGSIIDQPIMPKKGKRNKEETKREHHQEFIKLRNNHSAIESNIHQLQHNGMSRCPDRDIENFRRYASLSVLAYNLHKLGEHIRSQSQLKKAG